jgi:hypothetical protein
MAVVATRAIPFCEKKTAVSITMHHAVSQTPLTVHHAADSSKQLALLPNWQRLKKERKKNWLVENRK